MSSLLHLALVTLVLVFGVAFVAGDCSPIPLGNNDLVRVSSSNNITYFRAEVYDPNNALLQIKVYTVEPSTTPISVLTTLDDCSITGIQSAGYGVVSYVVGQAKVGVYTVAVVTELDKYYIQACVDGCPFICPGDCSSHGFCDQTSNTCTCNSEWVGETCGFPADWNPTPDPQPTSMSSIQAAHSFFTSFIITFVVSFTLFVCCRCFVCRRTCKNQAKYSKLSQTEVPVDEPKKSTEQTNTLVEEEPQQTQTQTAIPIPSHTVWTLNEVQTPQSTQNQPPFYLYPQTQPLYFPTQQSFSQYFAYPGTPAIPAYARVPNSNLN